MAKAKTEAVADINAFLTGAATPKGKKSKPEIPEIEGKGELSDRVAKAHKEKKDAEAAYVLVEGELVELVRKRYEQGAKPGETFHGTYNIPGDTTGGCQVSFKDQFKPMGIDQQPMLVELLGQEKFDENFTIARKLTAENPTDADIKLLIAALGEEKFKKLFAIKIEVAAKPDMDRNQFALPEMCRPEQYKPSTKMR